MQTKTPPQLYISEFNAKGKALSDWFACVADSPYSILFDSAGSTQSGSRFNIMAWSPAYVVESRNNTTSVLHLFSGTVEHVCDLPLKAVDALHHQYYHGIDEHVECDSLPDLPFKIGSAGLCGYDLGRYYEALPVSAKPSYACPDMAVGLYEQSLIEDTRSGKIYECRLSHRPPASEQLTLAAALPAFKLTSQWQSNLNRDNYIHALDKINAYLRAGDCYQVNLAQRFAASFKGNEWAAYQRLVRENQAPFSAFLRLEEACVTSISPERFMSVKKGAVQTKPIKGTRPRFSDPKKDKESAASLCQAEKDRAENLMIVDLLRNDLSKHCEPGSVAVPHLFTLESYAAVHHLVSTVTGQLKKDASPLDLLAGAFPGGSITGAPKVRAMEIIDELEPHRRNVYCGSMFYLGIEQDMDSNILIRTLLTENQKIYCWAGGGIVLDSHAQEEYQETLDKVSRILPTLEANSEKN